MKTTLSLLSLLLASTSFAGLPQCWDREPGGPNGQQNGVAFMQGVPERICVNEWRVNGTKERGFSLTLDSEKRGGHFAMAVMNPESKGSLDLSATIFLNNYREDGVECGQERQAYVTFDVKVDAKGKVQGEPVLTAFIAADANWCESDGDHFKTLSFTKVNF